MSNLELALKVKTDFTNAQQSLAALTANISQLSGESQGLSGQAGKAAAALSQMGNEAGKSVGGYTKAAQGVQSISNQLDRLQNIGMGLMGFNKIFSGASSLVTLADEYGQMASRIRMVT
ncbi:MAG: hypothetical protein LBI31_07505, partial [Zoogloeaceae bacterium]|nr:hypothetical protein [Zoogloeaceae bacterium]